MSTRSASNPRNLNNAKKGVSKKSAARAKPKTQAASSVRMASTKKTGGRSLTASERKARERAQRNDANRNLLASNILLKKDPDYKRRRTLWGVMLGVGLSMTIASWVVMLMAPETQRSVEYPAGKAALICLVLAYVLVIGAFIYDFVRVRKLRMAAEEKVAAMSERKVEELIREEAFAREAKKRARKNKSVLKAVTGESTDSAETNEQANEDTKEDAGE